MMNRRQGKKKGSYSQTEEEEAGNEDS